MRSNHILVIANRFSYNFAHITDKNRRHYIKSNHRGKLIYSLNIKYSTSRSGGHSHHSKGSTVNGFITCLHFAVTYSQRYDMLLKYPHPRFNRHKY